MINSVEKAMTILSLLSDAKNSPVRLAEIAERTGYPKPTCSHILDTLCRDGYVKHISRSAGYALGPSVYRLTRYGRYDAELVTLCRPVLRWLERKSHGTVVLSVIQSNRKFIIDYADGEQNLFLDRETIRTDDIYRTATGRAILAYMDRDRVKAVWDKYGKPPEGHWDSVTSYDSLLYALDEIRRHSVVVTDATDRSGDRDSVGYACPLFHRSRCIGAVGIAWKSADPKEYENREKAELLSSLVKKGAKEIMRRLSYEDKELGDT